MFSGPFPCGELQRPHLLEGQHSMIQAIQGVFRTHQRKLPDPSDRWGKKEKFSGGSHAHKQGMVCWKCEGWWQTWPQWPLEHGVQDPERKEKDRRKITALGFKGSDFGLFNNTFSWDKILEHPCWKTIRSGNTYTNWMYVSLWTLTGCTHESWMSSKMSLWGNSWQSLNNHGY